ncbi:MAG: hypothetical protein LUE27_04595 [Clostridia bacterium]|nr:hypothetical protein [Clostridia bacterium]
MAESSNLFEYGRIKRTYCTEWGDEAPAGFYENVCGFLNAFGGEVYIGVREDGTVTGMDENKAWEIGRALFHDLWDGGHIVPGFMMNSQYLHVAEDGSLGMEPNGGKTVLHFYVHMSVKDVHSVSGRIYEWTEEGNRDITEDETALLHLKLRKSRECTELRPTEAVWEDLDTDTIQRMRDMAVSKRQDHPWKEWEDKDLVRSLRLVDGDSRTGERHYALGALLLFGKDESLHRLLPGYGIDMVLRREDGSEETERISCNLFKAYDILMDFAHENVFGYHEADAAKAKAMDKVLRNLVVNFLVHREYVSPIPARFVISPDSISTENGHVAEWTGIAAKDSPRIYPERAELNELAHAFGEAGLTERSNTGLMVIAKNSRAFSAKPPVFIEGNIFRAIVYL